MGLDTKDGADCFGKTGEGLQSISVYDLFPCCDTAGTDMES